MHDAAEQLQALETYFNLMSMNGGVRVLKTARELGVFDHLATGPSNPGQIAEVCGLQEKPTTLLLDTLATLRLLESADGEYTLAPVMRFLSGNYQDLSDAYWDHLPELLKTGVPIARMDSPEESEQQYEAQVSALAWMMKPSAEAAAGMLGIGAERRDLAILDIGAGSAVWSLTCARKDASSTVTAMDWPAVLKVASAQAEAVGLSDRFTTIPGNYHEVEIPKDTYDLAIVGNVTHIETEKGNAALFRKVRRSLKPSGEIVIFDVLPGQDAGDLSRSLYALGLALRTEQGQVFSPEALAGFLEETGFEKPAFSPISAPPYTMGMLIARKGEQKCRQKHL